MTRGALDPLLRPRSVAVVGASTQEGKAGHAMMRSLLAFPGALYPVNARAPEVFGRTAFPTVVDLPEAADLAVLVVPAEAVPGVLEDCGARGVRAAVVCAGGFAESGPEGLLLQQRVAEVAERHDIRVLGPNTSGFMRPGASLTPNFMPAVDRLRAGPAAFVAQSGGMNLMLSFLADADGLGLSVGVGLGNVVNVDFADVLDDLAHDEETEVVGLHLEGVRDGGALCAALRRLAARKPVVAFKVGRHDIGEFARSHTGALAGSYPVAHASLAQCGAVLVDDPTELVDAMRALSGGRLRPGRARGVAVVTGQAGPGLVIADELAAADVTVPALEPRTTTMLAGLLPALTHQLNPVDTGRPGQSFPRVLAAVAQDRAIDVVVVHALDEPGALDPADALAAATAVDGVRVIFATQGPADAIGDTARSLGVLGVPTYPAPERAARAAAALVADAAAQHRLMAPGAGPALVRGPLPGVEVGEPGAKAVLAAAGIAVPRGLAGAGAAAAHAALRELGGPVVLKVVEPHLTHKTDVGGVRIGIRTPADLDEALESMAGLAADCYLVEQQVEPGVELIVGILRDPAFGPVILLGVGGTHVELEVGAAMRLLPMSDVDAWELIDSLPPAVLSGFRGGPSLDRAALLDVLLRVQDLVLHHNIEELEINPLRLTPTGAIALDAIVLPAAVGLDVDGAPVGVAVAGGN